MKNKPVTVFIVFLTIAAVYLIIIFNDNSKPSPGNETAGKPFLNIQNTEDALPVIAEKKHQIIKHNAYMLSYNEHEEQADWVAYILTAAKVRGTVKRKDNFRSDPLVKSGSASLADYRNSGFDRGHLAPAADMKESETTMSESFFMSNISPQKPSFNRGIWKKLEAKVRNWALQNDSLYVVTGPVFKDIEKTIGKNKVSVPGYYFKAILDISSPSYSAIAFILKNEGSKKDLFQSAVSIDSLESFTGYDFYQKLDDRVEQMLEQKFDLDHWK